MDENPIKLFYDSLIKAAELSGSTINSISRPVYLSTCKSHNIKGWTKEQIKNYKDGWVALKKDAHAKVKTLANPAMFTNPMVGIPTEATEREMVSLSPDISGEKSVILTEYAQFINTYHYVPTMSVFKKWIGRTLKREIYSSMPELDSDYRRLMPKEAEANLFDLKSWTPEYLAELSKEVSKHTKFVLVSIGSFSDINYPFLESLKAYADLNDAMVIGLPLVKSYKKGFYNFCVSPEVRKYMWITNKDVTLNNNLRATVIKANCNTKSTIAGLNQLVSKYDSSIIVPGINQQMKYIPILKDKTPHMIASTGCCTYHSEDTLIEDNENDWFRKFIPTKSEKLASDRIAIQGALVVEIGDEETFTVRNIEAEYKNGAFIDLAVRYSPDGAQDVENSTYIVGDLHAPKHNEELLDANIRVMKECRCAQVVLHDSVNMSYISHHNVDKAITRAQIVEAGGANVLTEIKAFADVLQKLEGVEGLEKIIIPYSNHPAHFERFIQDIGRMSKDDINLRTSLHTALAMLDNKNVLQYLTEEMVKYKSDKVEWVNEDDGKDIYGVQVGLHGSEKVNGGKMTSTSTNNAFRKTVLAHKHSAGIDNDTITVGICCEKEQGYNHGLSSWTESSAIVYPNGKAQLLTFVNVKGEYKTWL